MANLVRARSWGQVKPPPGAQIDWGHPLAQGLVFCALLNEQGGAPRDLLTGLGGAVANGASFGRFADAGIVFASVSSQSAAWTGITGPVTRAPTAGLTVAGSMVTGPGNYGAASRALISTCNANKGYCLFLDSNNNPRFVVNDNIGSGASSQAIGSIAVPQFFSLRMSASYDRSTGTHLYYRGTQQATNSGNTSVTFVAPGQVPTIGNTGTGDTLAPIGFLDGGVGYAYIWHRSLTASEHAWLAAEPYAFIAPPGPKILYFGFGATASTFNQSLSVTQTQTPSILRSVGKIILPVQTQTPTVVKSVGKNVNATQTQTSTLTRTVGKLISVTQTQASTVTRTVGKTLGFVQTQTATATKSVGKILAFVQTQLASLVGVKQGPTPTDANPIVLSFTERSTISETEQSTVSYQERSTITYREKP